MTNDKNINVSVRTIGPTQTKTNEETWTPERDEADKAARKFLRQRFFKTGKAGNEHTFYDVATDDDSQRIMHIVPAVLKFVPEMQNNYHWAEATVKAAAKDNTILAMSMKFQRYRPNRPPVVDIEGIHYRNTWRPPEVRPKKGDAAPFKEFIELALGGRKDEAEYVIKWLALLVQDPTPKRKPPVALYLFSDQQGHGKSLLAHIMTQVLGEEAVRLSSGPSALEDKNRIQFFSRTLFIADEAQIKAKQTGVSQAFKNLITSSQTDEALKNQQVRKHEVPARLMMLSNYPPEHLEPNDRRYFVARWYTGMEEEARVAYFKNLEGWLANEDGFGIISDYLATYDVTDWDSTAVAMVTDTKREVLGTLQDRWERAVADIIAEGDYWFVDTKHDFSELVQQGCNPNQLKHIMTNLGWTVSPHKDGTYRPQKKDVPKGRQRSSHYFWLSPRATLTKDGNAFMVEYEGASYSFLELYEAVFARMGFNERHKYTHDMKL